MPERAPSVLLFDLGGVLVDFIGPAEINTLLSEPLPPLEVARLWQEDQAIAAFETGDLTAEAFGDAFCAAWSLCVSPAEFVSRYATWVTRTLPGALDLLDDLRPRFRLAALSNSNVLHWTGSAALKQVISRLDNAFSSHEIGARKPDPRAFLRVLQTLAVDPADVLFFDDSHVNVDAASRLGLSAYQVQGPAGVRAVLQHLGLIGA
jgi:putative hydrolase of the HAD superfamily